MATENSVYLIRNYPIEIHLERGTHTPINGRQVNLSHQALLGASPLVEAVEEYIRKMKFNNGHLLSLYADILPAIDNAEGQLSFKVELRTHFFEKVCGILPSPFLQFVYRIKDPADSVGWTTHEKRVELTDIWKEYRNRFCLVPMFEASTGMDRNVSWDIILGWKELKPMKLSASSILQNLFGMESSKDLTLIAGDGVEVKCHRMIFEAHGDALAAMVSSLSGYVESASGRIEMKENSGIGLSHLIKCLYGIAPSLNEVSCEVVVELFKTAEKYVLPDLKEALEEFILQMGKEWFTADELLELYFYVRNLDGLKSLQDHLTTTMKSLSMEILACERFAELNGTDASVANGLWALLMSEQDSGSGSVNY